MALLFTHGFGCMNWFIFSNPIHPSFRRKALSIQKKKKIFRGTNEVFLIGKVYPLACTHALKPRTPLARGARLDCTTSQFSVCSVALRVCSAELKMELARRGFVRQKHCKQPHFSCSEAGSEMKRKAGKSQLALQAWQ